MLAKRYSLEGNDFNKFKNHSLPSSKSLTSFFCDWRKHRNVDCFRDLVKKNIARILETDRNYQWQLLGCDYVNVLENQLFLKAATEEEYINLDTLRDRLQSLILQRSDANCGEQVSNFSVADLKMMQTMGLTRGCSLDRGNTLSNCVGNKYNPMVADKSARVDFQKGLVSYEYSLGVTSMFDAFPVASKLMASEVVLSPDMNSTITTGSSVDGLTEIGTFDSGAVFSQGDHAYRSEALFKVKFQQQHFNQSKLNLIKFGSMENNQNLHGMGLSASDESLEYCNSVLQIPDYSQVSSILPSPTMSFGVTNSNVDNFLVLKSQVSEQNQQQSYQPKDLQVRVPSHLTDQNTFCVSSMHSQLPSEQSNGGQGPSESSAPFFSSKTTSRLENSSNLLHFSTRDKVLAYYVNYKSSSVPVGACIDSFLEHLHSNVCDNGRCYCEGFRPLLSHVDNCHGADCQFCAPMRTLCRTGKLGQNSKHVKNARKRDFNATDSSGHGSCCSGEIMPLSKFQKMEKPFDDFSSGDGIASVVAPYIVEPVDPGGLPPLQQLPESPASINSEFVAMNNELLMNCMKSFSSCDQIKNSGADNYPRLISESVSAPFKENNVGCSLGEMDSRNLSEIPDIVKDDCNQLTVSRMPILSEEVGTAFNEELMQVVCERDLTKPTNEDELNATIAEHEEQLKIESPKRRGASLIDFFTVDQIKRHISSFGKKVDQTTVYEDKTMSHVNENRCQLCAEDKLWFAPVPIYCSCCGARIKRGVIYYSASDEDGMRPCFCTSCYKLSRGGRITFYGITIAKAKLHKKKNDEATDESWVECDKCKGWQHQICSLFNDKMVMEGKTEYICPKCCLKEMESKELVSSLKAPVFGAKDLPSSILSEFIEKRLFRRLEQERREREKVSGLDQEEVPKAEDLVVRVVLSVKKQLKVKEKFLELFHGENYPAEFPYRSKVILLFQKIEGVDVCLFGLYVQEFGSECSYPNQRTVYISYLDSVKYFRPETKTSAGEALRTFVYHEILIGYLEYCKKRGFATCYLWACPPLKGEDYILYCHPEIQKTPKSDKLRQWYHSMLRKAAKENVVVDSTNLYDHFFVPTGQCYSKITAARLPYFDGCYWSDTAENILKSIEQENGVYAERKVKKVMTKRTLKAMGHTDSSAGTTADIQLMQKLAHAISPVKGDFIVVYLHFICMHCRAVISGIRWVCCQCKNFQLCERCHDVEKSLLGEDAHTLNNSEKHKLSEVLGNDMPSDTEDNDAVIENWHVENRHTFLGLCQKYHYQFDTLRLAKHSSMMILHHLHNPTPPAPGTVCRICHQDVDMKDRDVCAACYHKKDSSLHIYKLDQCHSAANHGTESTHVHQKELQQKELTFTNLTAQRLNQLLDILNHASRCPATRRDPCSYPECLKIKRLFHHTKTCSIRVRGGCEACKKVWHMLFLHASCCEQTDCCVPRCKDLINHLKRCAPTRDLLEPRRATFGGSVESKLTML